MKTRKSIIFAAKDKVEVVEEPLDQPKPGELQIETQRTLISTGTELICLGQKFAPGTNWEAWVKYPFRSGYLNAGRVIGMGDAVTGFKIGDRVAARFHHTSHLNFPADRVIRIPDNLSDEDAAWMGLGKITQVGVRTAEHKMGDNV